jgi:hypothetical protein
MGYALLAQFEEQAATSATANRESYMEMLAALQSEIRNRVRTGVGTGFPVHNDLRSCLAGRRDMGLLPREEKLE